MNIIKSDSGQLIKKTSRRLVTLENYNGVCHSCNSPIHHTEKMTFIEMENQDTFFSVIPIDAYECPYCGEIMKVMQIYKNLEVSKEFVRNDKV